jgi:uncharacterized membrane protein YbhN (UPF0104 family)
VINRVRKIISHPLFKAGYLVLLLAATAYYLARWGDRLSDLLSRVQPAWVGAAFAVVCLSALLYSYIQYAIYHRLGAQSSYWAVFRIVAISQLGKYLPGKVLFVGNYYLFSREAGIDRATIGTSFVISMALWMLTASLCGLPVLSLLEPTFSYLILILPLVLALLIHPRLLDRLLRMAQWLVGRARGLPVPETGRSTASTESLLANLDARFYLWVAFLYLATWALAGIGAYLCIAALTPVEPGTYPLALASISLGTVAGFLALFAPVGLGVREGVGALILAPAVGSEVALMSMILLRGATVAVDLLLALLAVVIGQRTKSNTGSRDLGL